MNRRRLLRRLLGGSLHVSPADTANFVEGFGVRPLRIRGSRHLFVHREIAESVNLAAAVRFSRTGAPHRLVRVRQLGGSAVQTA